MKKLKINIDDKAYNQIKQNALVRRSVDGVGGAMDELSIMIISAIEDGKKEITLTTKTIKTQIVQK